MIVAAGQIRGKNSIITREREQATSREEGGGDRGHGRGQQCSAESKRGT